jgi:predicted nucleic acid-binding protein
MKKCYLDSNVLVYFKDEKSLYHKKVIEKFIFLIKNDFYFYVSSLVLDEFLYVFRYFLEKNEKKDIFSKLKKALTEILAIPNLSIVSLLKEKEKQIEVISYMERYDLSPRDAYHLMIMKENAIDYFFTFDKDFELVFKENFLKKI